ncbi:hypothetical protein [Thermococcus sp.]|uniref:hypothetical protein n=1 Tax=Thermococcus sp. TaxID=35749 RepID=UPI0026121284|nr:hypothetical protein [Thermococcus sp.]
MERLKELIGRKENGLDFVRDMVEVLLSEGDVYSDEVLFRDAVEEVYRTLRREVISNGREDLVEAYETAVLLRAVASKTNLNSSDLLLEIRKKLG